MKKLLIALMVALAFTGCKKSGDTTPIPTTYINNPTPGSPAAVIEASLVGNWIQTFGKVTFYNADGTVNKVLDLIAPPGVKAYWQFYKPDGVKDTPTKFKGGPTLDRPEYVYYLIEIDNNIPYLDRFQSHPGDLDKNKIKLTFPDKDNLTATFIGVDPSLFLAPGDPYKGNNADLTFGYKRL